MLGWYQALVVWAPLWWLVLGGGERQIINIVALDAAPVVATEHLHVLSSFEALVDLIKIFVLHYKTDRRRAPMFGPMGDTLGTTCVPWVRPAFHIGILGLG